MKIRLAAPIESDSVVDGFGVRAVIWTQGCFHNCPFCQNPQTHDINGGMEFELEDIFAELDMLTHHDGITLSGGDPMFQVEASKEIAKYAQSIGLNVWCYTGFTYEEVLKLGSKNNQYLEFLKYIDVLVDGKFDINKKSFECLFRGSTNQRLIDMKETLKQDKIVLLKEDDGIIDRFKTKEKMFI